MGVEIERKFLVQNTAFITESTPKKKSETGVFKR